MFSVNKKQSIHNFQAGDWDFFLPKLGKKSPTFSWERGPISTPESTKKIPGHAQATQDCLWVFYTNKIVGIPYLKIIHCHA